MSKSQSRSTLSDEAYERCLQIAVEYVARNQTIRNRQLREVTGISYDQAIYFFNRAIGSNRLVRKGTGSSTYYVGGVAQ
jgi:predicted HTH transcriptional regulator